MTDRDLSPGEASPPQAGGTEGGASNPTWSTSTGWFISALSRFFPAVALGLGLTAALLLCLASQAPAARANPGTYYVRKGGTGDCRSINDPCEIVQRAVNLAISPG